MSINAECKMHNLCLKVSENDSEYVLLEEDIAMIIEHLEQHPECKFKEVSK